MNFVLLINNLILFIKLNFKYNLNKNNLIVIYANFTYLFNKFRITLHY